MPTCEIDAASPTTSAPRVSDRRRKRKRRAPAAGAATDCFTCSIDNLNCDRRRPYCSPCLEAKRRCSGYKTPLIWVNGVASRGKLRGQSLPVAGTPQITTSLSRRHDKAAQLPPPPSSSTGRSSTSISSRAVAHLPAQNHGVTTATPDTHAGGTAGMLVLTSPPVPVPFSQCLLSGGWDHSTTSSSAIDVPYFDSSYPILLRGSTSQDSVYPMQPQHPFNGRQLDWYDQLDLEDLIFPPSVLNVGADQGDRNQLAEDAEDVSLYSQGFVGDAWSGCPPSSWRPCEPRR